VLEARCAGSLKVGKIAQIGAELCIVLTH